MLIIIIFDNLDIIKILKDMMDKGNIHVPDGTERDVVRSHYVT